MAGALVALVGALGAGCGAPAGAQAAGRAAAPSSAATATANDAPAPSSAAAGLASDADVAGVNAGEAGAAAAGRGRLCDEGAARLKQAAIDRFWSIFHGNDYAHIGEAQSWLRRARQRNPRDAELTALEAATHFWHVGEAARDPHPDPAVLAADMPTAARLFGAAYALDPDDDHLPGFAGVTSVHAGVMGNDPALAAAGDRLIAHAVYQFPEFNNFNKWAAHNNEGRDSDAYRQSLAALWSALDACIAGTLDRRNPDLGPYLGLFTSSGRKRVCWANTLAPHAFEGFMLNLGNGLVKANQPELARVAFANAKLVKSYDTWPYRAELEALLQADLGARAALYADADPHNDPPLAVPGRSCSYCHATVAEP